MRSPAVPSTMIAAAPRRLASRTPRTAPGTSSRFTTPAHLRRSLPDSVSPIQRLYDEQSAVPSAGSEATG